MYDRPPLLHVVQPRRIHLTVSSRSDGYVDLRTSIGTDVPRHPMVERYERLTASEALDVIEATVFEQYPTTAARRHV